VSDRVVVGRAGKPHGLDGSFVVENASADARWFRQGARLVVNGEELEVLTARQARGRPVIRLERIVERGVNLEVPVESLPPTAEGEYYAYQLVGLEVVEEGGRDLGRVRAVEPGVANDALALEGGLLLPLVETCIRRIDLEAGRILVAPGFSDSD
jgi:16S rRNA processing protein RimM